MTLQPITIDGRSGTVVYIDATWTPVEPDHATLARVLFDDGGTAFYRVEPLRAAGDVAGHEFHGNQWTTGFDHAQTGVPIAFTAFHHTSAANAERMQSGEVTNQLLYVSDEKKSWASPWVKDQRPVQFTARLKNPVVHTSQEGTFEEHGAKWVRQAKKDGHDGLIYLSKEKTLGKVRQAILFHPMSQIGEMRSAGSATSGNFGHSGRPGEIGGSGPGGRSFTSEEGYQWHETGPVVEWAKALPYDDHRAFSGYAGFGSTEINNNLRGKPPTDTERVRGMTAEEIAAVSASRQETSTDSKDPIPPEGVGYTYSFDWRNRPPGKDTLNDEWAVRGPVVNLERQQQAVENAAKINDAIASRGYVLPETIEVGRGAYIPGMTEQDLRKMVGGTFEEKGFTSTMVGNAQGRLDGYGAAAKFESLYRQYGTIHGHEDEPGTAMTIMITIPAGTKIASIESSRRLEFDHPRIQDPTVFQHPEWTADGKTKPSDYTMTDYSKKPTVSTKRLADKNTRSESELLLGSGAQFKVVSVTRGKNYESGDHSLKPVPVMQVRMVYVGGGSSDPKKQPKAK